MEIENRSKPKQVQDFINDIERKKELEREASMFALLLLIPQKLIMADIKNGVDLGSDDALNALAKKYGVSKTAMAMRIGLLNLR